MNTERDILLDYLNKKGLEYKKYRIEELVEKTQIPYPIISSLLNELELEGKIYIDNNNLISSFPPHLVIGKLNINKNLSANLSYNGHKYRLKRANKQGILNQDTIIARPTGEYEHDMELIKLEKIVKRNNGIIIGEVQEKHGNKYIIDINNTITGNIIIPPTELKKYVNGDRLKIIISTEKENDSFKGEVAELIAHKDDPDLKVKSHLAKFDLKTGFSEEALKEAEEANRIGITPEHLKGRANLRKFNNIAIDPATCKDRDDSFFLKRLENGHKIVCINIVDITPWVYPGTAMWKEAEEKDSSAYIYDTSEPMLPRPISNGIGSLNENEDRLTETLVIEFDKNYDIFDYYMVPSVVNTKKNATYDDVNKLLEENIVLPGYEKFKDDLLELNAIAEKVYINLVRNGFLDFPSDDKEYKRNEKNETIEVTNRYSGKAQKMVEVFMVLADSLIPNLIYLPAPYRNHEDPDSNIFVKIQGDLANLGVKIKINPNLDPNLQIRIILKKIKNHPLERVISKIIVKKLKKAYYSPDNIGHFGLGLKKYLQWTSPDRRFNDLILFHIIKLQRRLEKENLTQKEYNTIYRNIYEYLKTMCERISYIERQINLAEKESFEDAIKEIQDKHSDLIGAQITYLNSRFILLKTNDGREGRLNIGKNYRYNKKTNSYIHKKYKFHLEVGNLVKVKIKGINDEKITFDISNSEAQRLSLTLK